MIILKFKIICSYMAAILMATIAFFSPWAAYNQLALGITPVTLPAFLLFLLWIFVAIEKSRIRKFDRQDIACIILLAITGLSFFWSLAPSGWTLQYFYYLLCISTFVTAKSFLISAKLWLVVVCGFVLGACVAMVLVSPQESEFGVTLQRQSIEGINSNYVAYVLAGIVSLLFVSAKRFSVSLKVWTFIIFFVMMVFYKIVLLGTRGAIVSVCLLGLWPLIFKYFGKRSHVLIFVFVLFALLFFSFGVFDSILLFFDKIYMDRDTGDLSGRLVIWPLARNLIFERPFFGIGAGAFVEINPLGIGAHNLILTMLLEGGFLGLGALLIIVFGSLSPSLKMNASSNSKFAAGSFLCYWAPIAFSGHWELAIASWLILVLHALAVIDNNRFWS